MSLSNEVCCEKRNGSGSCQVPEADPATLNSAPQVAGGYAELLDQYSEFGTPSEGEIVRGRVLKVTANEVLIDVGCKSEGLIPLQEFLRPDGSVEVKPGDEIDVLVESSEDLEGHIILSRERAERISAWSQIEQAFNDQTVVSGVVIDRIKGGLSVDIGLRAFLPGSQVDIRAVKNLDSFKGKRVDCKVIKINKRRGNIVLSRKALLEEQLTESRQAILQSLEEGTVLQGVVKNITDYGAFVDLGGIDGLLHISDISWGRVSHPSQTFSLGQRISVQVLKFERERQRISLGYKQLQPDPWLTLTERHSVGSQVRGKVVSLTDYGVFLEVEAGVEGLIHVSELSWSKRMKSPCRLFSVGDVLEAMILDINTEERRMSLGIKQLKPDPWTALGTAYTSGSVIQGIVRNLTNFGAFIEVAEGIDGLVHISDLSWLRKVRHPSEVLRKGQQVSAVVLHVDLVNHRLSLGIKQLQPNAWDMFFSSHHGGEIISGKVSRITSFGVFVELEGGIEGLCHRSQFQQPFGDFASLSVGEYRDFQIIRLQPQEKKIGLCFRIDKAGAEPEKASAQAAASSGSQLRSQSFGP
jgi:small subunit ribosomal protein S1